MNKKCVICGKEFKTEDKRQKYCSRRCWYDNMPNKKVVVKCDFCGKEKKIFPSRLKIKHHFCNEECQNNWQKTYQLGNDYNRNRIKHEKKSLECLLCKSKFTSRSNKAKFCSNVCRLTYLNERQKRENHPSWKGGTTTGRRLDESQKIYKEWKKTIFKRDKYCCAICGQDRKLNAHHIKTFSEHPELRTELCNGITLCERCHKLTYAKELCLKSGFIKQCLW